jgi:hypothetical protein
VVVNTVKSKLRIIRLIALCLILFGASATFGLLMFLNLTAVLGTTWSIIISLAVGLSTAFGYSLVAIGRDWDE